MRVAIDERSAAHHHARRAEPALHRVVLDERLLDGMKRVAVGESLDRRDTPASRVEGERHAARCHLAVEPHSARRAGASVATDFGAGQTELVAQHLHERRAGIGCDAHCTPIDLQGKNDGVGPNHSPPFSRCRAFVNGHTVKESHVFGHLVLPTAEDS
jgi:hypothetical protein